MLEVGHLEATDLHLHHSPRIDNNTSNLKSQTNPELILRRSTNDVMVCSLFAANRLLVILPTCLRFSVQGSIVSAIGSGIIAVISAIAGVLETIISAIVGVRSPPNRLLCMVAY